MSGWCQIAPLDPAATNKCLDQKRSIWYTLLVSEVTLNKVSAQLSTYEPHLKAAHMTEPNEERQRRCRNPRSPLAARSRATAPAGASPAGPKDQMARHLTGLPASSEALDLYPSGRYHGCSTCFFSVLPTSGSEGTSWPQS